MPSDDIVRIRYTTTGKQAYIIADLRLDRLQVQVPELMNPAHRRALRMENQIGIRSGPIAKVQALCWVAVRAALADIPLQQWSPFPCSMQRQMCLHVEQRGDGRSGLAVGGLPPRRLQGRRLILDKLDKFD
jgi:hypothetical protein